MAIDVLTVNAILEENDRLKKAVNAGTPTFAELFALTPTNTSLWSCIPRLTSGTSFNVCSTSADFVGGACCLFTVPGGVTRIHFQLWGAGSPSGPVMCCMNSPFGDTGAFTSVILCGSFGGCQYTICAGCSHNCYGCAYCNTWSTAGGCPSFVTGFGLTNLCAEGGADSYVGCTMADHFCDYTATFGGITVPNCCRYKHFNCSGSCLCFTGMSFCTFCATGGCIPVNNSGRKGYGSTSLGTVYSIPSLHSGGCVTFDGGVCTTFFAPPVISETHTVRTGSECVACHNFNLTTCCCGGCFFKACCGIFQWPGAGGFASAAHAGAICIQSDTGRMGMVRVTYC